MTLDDYLEEFRRTLNEIHKQQRLLNEQAATVLENINKIKHAQYQKERATKEGSNQKGTGSSN